MILCTPQSKGYPGSDSVCIAHSNSPGYPLDEKYIYDRFVCPPTINFFQNCTGIQGMRAFAYMKTKIFLQREGVTGAMGEDVTVMHRLGMVM